MRSVIALAMLSLAALPLAAQPGPVREIAPDVYFYFGDEAANKPANCTWVVFHDYVLAIDANYPWGAQEILSDIRKTTSKPVRFVFNTHYHHDHTFGNSVFVDAGATVISTGATAEEMRGPLGQGEWNRGEGSRGHSLKEFRREFPTLTFDDRLVFDDGEHRVELIRMGPAHTRGDGVAFLPKEKILATGDLFVNGNPWGNNVADPDADYDRWLTVLDTLAGWDVNMVVPGHGGIGDTNTIKLQRAYLAGMLDQVRRGIAAGKTADQLVKEIDLSAYGSYGANTVSNVRSIRNMYRRLAGPAGPR